MPLPAPSRNRSIWVGAAGTGTAFGLIRAARERWGGEVRIIAADINPGHLVAASALADQFVQVPRVDESVFAGQLLAGLRQHAVDTYVPILDREIVLAAELAELGQLPEEVALLGPSVSAARICLDKLATAEWLRTRGLASPRTTLPAHATWEPAGLFVKPRCGVGSVGTRVLSGPAELQAIQDATDLVVQELCEPPEITIDVFRGRTSGFVRAICRERIEVKAGVCTKARVFEDPTLAGLARQVAEGLEFAGTFCLQVMRRANRWNITDINPRPGAGTRMTGAAGIDLLCAALADLWGLDLSPMLPPLASECFVARQYAEYRL